METSDYAEQRDDLLRSIESDRQNVRVALHELTGAAGIKLDLGQHIRTSPLTWAFGAFLVGVWLGSRDASAGPVRQRRAS